METIWITGASSGIGEALCREYAKLGHNLVISARNESKLNELKAQLPDPTKVAVLPLDLANLERLSEIVEQANSFFTPVDRLILNAGLSQRSLVQESQLQVYRDLMEVNYFGNIALAHAQLKVFEKNNKGQFVVITSLVGKFGTPYRSGYSASKHALHGHFDSLRAELMMQDKNIDVTIICPGFVSTNISYNALGGSGSAIHTYDNSNANGLTPEDFARKAVPVIQARKYEALIGGKETVGVYIKRFFPSVFAKMIAKAKVR